MKVPDLVLVVRREVPSQNRRDRVHWSDRHRDTKTWEWHLRAAVRQLPQRPTGLLYVTITSLRTQLITDRANFSGGAKGLVDALVRLGFVRDDSDEYCHITYRQVQAPKPLRCTRITVSHYPS